MSVRYQVINKGALWHIIDRSNGRTVGFATSHQRASDRAATLDLSWLIQMEMCRGAA
jgi:hypothetical protein